LQSTADKQAQEILQLTNEITQAQQTKEPEAQKTNRSAEVEGKRRTMEVTAYDLSYQSCQKHPDHPLYGITASGKYAEAWNTIAAGPELPFGAKVYIPYFADKPNGGIFTVHDRGGGVKDGRIDVYIESYADCMEFGRRQLEVWVME
jgi:3D (Asp-Asp-Asp) domain-containing protein